MRGGERRSAGPREGRRARAVLGELQCGPGSVSPEDL